ncbi:MAG: integrase catalytic domain-containing protein, partial [Ktedonobacteraceae bacterium]
LKHAIPVRTFADWDDAVPGFVEVDLVAHCGESTHGEYLNSLTMTDISTTWTECFALRNRSQPGQ